MISVLGRLWQGALAQAHRWRPNNYLTVIGDGAGWVLDYEAEQLIRTITRAGGAAHATLWPWPNQAAFVTSRVAALRGIERWQRMNVPVCFPYYHGYPGEGEAVFDQTYEQFRRNHAKVARVQVTHPRMRSLLLETGMDEAKLRTILIGVDTGMFVMPTIEQKGAARDRLGVPRSAVVIGSFQKDGNGWGDGLEPKLIKGPDVFLKAVRLMKATTPELFVLLSGPSRGYVRKGLDDAGIRYVYAPAASYTEMPTLYHALDAYIVSSRQEGGPKAVLESMASGVPIISTRVGQAPQLIRHGDTGWLAEIDDAEALADCALRSLDETWRARACALARQTAQQHDYLAQLPQWLDFFQGLLRFPAAPIS